MTIRIILAGAGGELDRHEIDCRDDDSAEVSHNLDMTNGRANIAFLGSKSDIWHHLGHHRVI